MKEPTKYCSTPLVLCASLVSLIYSPIAYTADSQEIVALGSEAPSLNDNYTINFNNVSIIELIRFASKISGLNFIFEEADLQFSVTVVSEEAISPKSVLSVLSQVLRMRNLNLVEQGGNVLITSSKKINQIPRIISSSEMSKQEESAAALVTRVFQIKNTNIVSVAAIIRPLISDTALLEVLVETKQLIVTDVPTNVDQISSLLGIIDTPHSGLEVDTYVVKNVAPGDLLPMVKELLAPFIEGNPLILVPQPATNSIFIVSTAYLVEKAITMLQDLDHPPAPVQLSKESGANANSSFFVYHPKYRPGEELEKELNKLGANFKEAGLADPAFLSALQSMKWNPGTNSLVFTGTPPAIEKIQSLLATIDVKEGVAPNAKGVFLYKLNYVSCQKVLSQMRKLAEKIPTDTPQNRHLIAAVNSAECVTANNSILITGTTGAIDQIRTMIAEFDTQAVANSLQESSFFIYKPKYLSPDEIQAALLAIVHATSNAGLKDPALVETIQSMHYVAATNSLIFTGPPEALQKLQQLLLSVDVQQTGVEDVSNVTFLLYRAQYVSPETLAETLKQFALQLDQANITNREIVLSINSVKVIPDKQSLLFTGSTATLDQIDNLLKRFDNPQLGKESPLSAGAGARTASSFVIYHPHYASGPELIGILQEFVQTLMQAGVSDPALFDAVQNLKWVPKTSSLIISGSPEAITQVQLLLGQFDVPGAEQATPTIESIDNTSFLVYKLQYHPGNDIQTALKQVAASLDVKGTKIPAELINAINSVQWLQVTNSLLCTGPQDILLRLKDLIHNLDVPLRQVFIEVLVIETTLNNQQNFGLMWGGQVKYLNKTILNSGNFPLTSDQGSLVPNNTAFPTNLQGINGTTTPSNTSIPFTTGFDLGVIGDIIMHKGRSFISLGSLLNALQQDADSTVILNPKIVTQDNRQSTIFVGQNVPYTGAIVTNQQANTTTTANIEYRDVGVSLTITPFLGEEDVVTMDIVHDISELTNQNTSSTSTTVLTGIQTTHTHMETRVHVPNNHFVALSGMIDDTKTHFKTGIPCLGGLPVIGAIFSENDRGATKNNIIIFVRPQIITSYEEYKKLTEHQEWIYKDSARMPNLKEEFDEGLDLVKLPENE